MSVSKWAYNPEKCDGDFCHGDCDNCGKADLEINLYDEEETHTNCTVQISRNSITGETSIGWWENE